MEFLHNLLHCFSVFTHKCTKTHACTPFQGLPQGEKDYKAEERHSETPQKGAAVVDRLVHVHTHGAVKHYHRGKEKSNNQ